MIRAFSMYLFRLFAIVMLGGLLGASLVRFAPGFGIDERELDPRLSAESVEARGRARAGENDVLRYYARYLAGMLTGELGESRSLGRPVAELLGERLPVTFGAVGTGLAAGWILGLLMAAADVGLRSRAFQLFSAALAGALLCLPAAVLGLFFLLADGPAEWAIAVVIFPRVFRYSRNLLAAGYAEPYVLMARAKGLHPGRILAFHVLPASAPQMLALAGVSVGVAFGAAIPIEVICDSPGIGQLAWQAALGRDLPLLINLTLIVTLVTVSANALSDLAAGAWRRSPA